jgi:ADP-ribosylglycohydrolase
VIDGMPEDDDINYTLVALAVLERHGSEFTTEDVAQMWLADLPVLRTFTAERAAYRNLLDGVAPPVTATRRNPFREWIGAQIRTDMYGWVMAGRPTAAAELAWRDARLSHTRNGLYGAMFAAAMGAAAVVASDVATVINSGLAVIPPESRLAKAVRLTDELHRSEPNFEEAADRLYEAYGDLHWVHAINNAAMVVLALRFGGGDFAKSICGVVSGGWDTDSNGATVGGITGALAGARALPADWILPLHNRLSSSLRGFDGAKFDDLARRTHTLTRRLA